MRLTPDGLPWITQRLPLLPPSRALVHAIAACLMKYRLGYEDDGWRGEIGVEIIENLRVSRAGHIQFTDQRHRAPRHYWEFFT